MKRMSTKKSAIDSRTRVLLAGFRGNADEFKMLKGVLCMDHGQEYSTQKQIMRLFNLHLIAARMDEMNAETTARYRAEAQARAASQEA